MEKYDEIKANLYVKEVGNLYTLKSAAKLLGVSSKQLRKFVIEEQIRNNNLIVDMMNGVFKFPLLSQNQLDFYISQLEQKNNIEYAAAVIDNAHPNMKQNPNLFIYNLITYNKAQLKELDDVNLKLVERETNTLEDYVSKFASDYGISSKRLYNFLSELQKKNNTIFAKLFDLYKLIHNDKDPRSIEKIKTIPNIEYITAAIIYNFPGLVSTADGFFGAIETARKDDIEKTDSEEINDPRIQRFLSAKQNYSIAIPTK